MWRLPDGTLIGRPVTRGQRPWVRRVTRQARRLFAQEHRLVQDRAAFATNPSVVLDVARDIQDQLEDQWHRFYRQTYFQVGAAYARRGAVPKRLLQRRSVDDVADDPEAWGPAGDAWYYEELLPAFGDEPWWGAWMEEVQSYTTTTSGARVQAINAATRRQLRRTVQASIDRGDSILDTMKAIDAMYLDQVIPHRSEVIARTEVLTAARAGSYHTVKAQGLQHLVTKSWLTAGDERVRGSGAGTGHALAGATQVDLPYDEPFHVVNVQTGFEEQLLFPGDTSLGAGAGNIVQCRCDTVRRVK